MTQEDRDKWNERYRQGAYATRRHPSALLQEWIDRIPRGRALDVACGRGRNALYLARNEFRVDAVDISREALKRARSRARTAGLDIRWIEHDFDQPLELDRDYALILVIRYVNLPLIGSLVGHLAPGGFLIVEEHLTTEADVAGPSSPAFRVAPGDLALVAGGLHVHLLQEGLFDDPDDRRVALARLVAQRR